MAGLKSMCYKKGWRQEVGGNYSPQCWRRTSWTGHLSHPKGHQCPTTDRHTQDRTGRNHHSTQTDVWKGQAADAKEVKSQTKQGKSNVRCTNQPEQNVGIHKLKGQAKSEENKSQKTGNIRLVCQICELTKEEKSGLKLKEAIWL